MTTFKYIKGEKMEYKCDICDKIINLKENYWSGCFGTNLCEVCGENFLGENEDYGYIFYYDAVIIYDDDGVGIERFKLEKNE